MKTQLLIAAGGIGSRLGAKVPKALVELDGKPLLVRTLDQFGPLGLVASAVVVAPASHTQEIESALSAAYPGDTPKVVAGGNQRQQSVAKGLERLDKDTELVVIHDAARPFVELECIRRAIEAAGECGAATLAIPTVDTILQGDDSGFLAATPDRSLLWQCQTPQVFRADVIRAAHEAARSRAETATDDATLVCHNGGQVKLVEGSRMNVKITTPEDLALADYLVRENLLGPGE